MGAIFTIHIHISGKKMMSQESLLTLANVLGKVASAALIVPTTEALGQLKWSWFHNSNAIWDFEIFDKASRGPWGAALLLYRTKGQSLAALGAVLVLLLLAIDTFFQQVVCFQDQWALQPTVGEIPRTVYYDPLYLIEFQNGLETSQINNAMLPVVREFFYNNGTQPIVFGNGTRPGIPLSCPTGRCVWPKYETLAVCNKCTEVSHHIDITFQCANSTIDWSSHWQGPLKTIPYPNGTVCGYFLNATGQNPMLLSGYILNETLEETQKGEALLMRTIPLTTFLTKIPTFGTGSVAFKDIRSPIIDTLVASTANGAEGVYCHQIPSVNECVLFWCVQTIVSSYNLGIYSEEITSTFHNTTPGLWPWDSWRIEDENGGGTFIVYKDDISIEPQALGQGHSNNTVSSRRYGANNVTACNVMNIFNDFFPAYYTADNASAVPRLRNKEYGKGPSVRTLEYSAWQAPNNLTRYMERLATAMTNVMRSSRSKEMVLGKAFNQAQYITVQWTWLIFPLVLLILTVVFLSLTIARTSKDLANPVWKTSAMPTLINSLPVETQTQLPPVLTWGSARKTRKMRVRLLPNAGWRVSGQDQIGGLPQPKPSLHQEFSR